jgi:hypothetical protein
MSDQPLETLKAARRQWTERRRHLVAGMVKGAEALSLSDDSVADQFIHAQSMIEAIKRAIEDEESRSPD